MQIETVLPKTPVSTCMAIYLPQLGEADPGGLGACPQEINRLVVLFFFQKKKQKA
jgi:hypothetical protein